MGLLDWLTEGTGSSSLSGLSAAPNQALVNATNAYSGPGGQPDLGPSPQQAPPVAPTAPPVAPPAAVPIQQGPPPGVGTGNPAPGLPPGAPPVAPPLAQPSAPQSAPPRIPGPYVPPPSAPPATVPVSPQAPGMPTAAAQVTNPGQGPGFLGQMFGMNAADEKNTLSSLGAGLKAVPANAHQPGIAAFAGTAGASIEGYSKSEDKRIDQMLKLIQQKQKAGDDSSALSIQQVKLETAKLQLQNLKDNNGKSGAYNKPPQQLYQDAMRLSQNDPNVKASEKALEETIKNGKPAEIAKAQQEHAQLVAVVQDKHLAGVGLPPQSAAAVAKQPGLTAQNPVPQTAFANKPFDQVMKPQPYDQYFVDENGQTRVLKATSKGDAAKAPPAAQATSASSPAVAADEDD